MYTFGANLIFVFHVLWALVAIFGWLIPALWPLYMAVLAATLISLLFLSHCPLTRWEFNMRRKVDPTASSSSVFLAHYLAKLLGRQITDAFILRAGLVFVVASIAINLYFRFFFE